MDYQTLFTAALGLTPPWEVQDIKFSQSQNRMDIWVGFPEGNTFTCPACGQPGMSVYDTKEKIIEEGKKKSRFLKKGSLIFANCGVSLGFARIITFDGCIHDGWLALRDIDGKLNKIFLLKTLNSYTDYFRAIAPDGTQPNLNTTIVKNFEIPIPPIQLQNQFAEIVTKIEEQKALVQKAIDETQYLFDSLMNEYFD